MEFISLKHEVVAALLDTQAKRLRGLLRAAALWKRRVYTRSIFLHRLHTYICIYVYKLLYVYIG